MSFLIFRPLVVEIFSRCYYPLMDISLRTFQTGDEEAAVRWSRDQAFCVMNGWTLNLSAEKVRYHWQKKGNQAKALRMIDLDGEIVGYIEWQNIKDQIAELGIAIGNSYMWGKGIGAIAGNLALDWGFSILKFEKVWADVHETNISSLKLMLKLGFVEVSRKGTEEYQGKTVSMVQFELTKHEHLKLMKIF